ncbi:ergosterol biosynthesis protein-like protein Erg28 [Trematosphaeria pertusa]|uniref:Ergosterol biosynthesis protein-like protein Erg28 n=1 Tax=Trematosphaeria pertusa TaxID=390896 RepID=A0A6A6IBD8_9PLEO|nr:ergosterol biosynthesis protein-like protein Erg28 [Trematosphaeria pertusa]KAF2247232.1 ergosterol biosynthesis protein-like protein Erg28 [Trematosphaeria pertusa]
MPRPDGYLPYFLIYTSLSAYLHSLFCYLGSHSAALRHFSGPQRPPPTQLLAHVYAVKNIYTASIRAYAAWDITNQAVYDLAILSYVGVLWLFASELLLYRTVRWREAGFPFLNAGVGLIWMVVMRGWYLGG